MSTQHVMQRVAADLERGHTHLALQRLASLTAAYPDDLDVRGKRAAVCRQVGNLTEAGRWGFLTETATEPELAAFGRAFPDPWQRLRALRMADDPAARLGPTARERLRSLLETAAPDASIVWGEHGPHVETQGGVVPALACGALAFLALAVLAMAVVGVISTVAWFG